MKNFLNKKNIGFMTVEVLVALSIITISVLATSNVVQKSFYLSQKTLENVKTTFLLEQGAELVRLYRNYGWDNVGGLTVGNSYYFQEQGGSESIYSFVITESPTDLIDERFRLYFKTSDVSRDNTSHDIVTSGGYLDDNTKLITIYVDTVEGEQIISTRTLSFYLANIN